MDIGSVASSGGALGREQIAEQVDVRDFRKAIEIAEQTATAMIEALPEPGSDANPSSLGNSVDMYV